MNVADTRTIPQLRADAATRRAVAARRMRANGTNRYDRTRKDRRAEDYLARPFVAVDGEGVTLADGEHVYTLLADSTGRGVSDPGGLSTRVCFDFLLGLSGQLVAGFAFGYDANMILRDVPRKTLERLHATGKAYWRDRRWPGGLQYRIAWIPRKSLIVTRYRGSYAYPVQDGSVTVWDTWGFFQASFLKALEQWKIGTPEQRAYVAGMKDARSDFLHVDAANVETYNALECTLLVELLTALRQTLYDAGIRLARWDGAGAVAGAMLSAHKVADFKMELPDEWSQSDGFYDAMRAYYEHAE